MELRRQSAGFHGSRRSGVISCGSSSSRSTQLFASRLRSAADATAAMAKFTGEKAGSDVMLGKAQDPKFTGKAPPAACPTQ